MSVNTSGYKALVCFFLYGGNQSFNTIIPTSNAKYTEYATVRAGLAVPQANIIPLNPTYFTASDGYQYGLHPGLTEIAALANSGKVAVISNVGTLVRPTTNTQFKNGVTTVPYQLFSHADQQNQWQTSYSGLDGTVGWAGKTGDLLTSQNVATNLSFGISTYGAVIWNQGINTDCYVVGDSGAVALNIPGFYGQNGTSSMSNTLLELINDGINHNNIFVKQLNLTMNSSISKYNVVASALSANDFSSNISFTHSVTASDVVNNAHIVARLIKGQSTIKDARQMFFIGQGNYDTHDLELTTQATLYAELGNTIFQFYNALVEIGMENDVVIFTNSDFGRSLVPNSDGSDHGWGGHSLVIGNTVHGGIYGTMPSLVAGGKDDALTTGRIIPTTPTDNYAASLLRWFGIRGYDLPTILPNIVNFPSRRVGFPNDFVTYANADYSYYVSNTVTANAFVNTPSFTQRNGGTAAVQVNNWDTTSPGFINQTTWANSERDFGVYANHVNDGNVKSYSAYVRGWKYGPGWVTTTDPYLANAGIQLSSLTKYNARFGFEGPTQAGGGGTAANNRVNTLWDIYCHATPSPGGPTAPSVNLMLQQYTLDSDGSYFAYAANSTTINIGNSQYSYVIANNFAFNGNSAQTYTQIQVYPGLKPNANFSGYQDATCDVRSIINYFTTHGVINSSHYLTSIQMGWEILAGNTANSNGTYIVNEAWSALQSEADGPSGSTLDFSFVYAS